MKKIIFVSLLLFYSSTLLFSGRVFALQPPTPTPTTSSLRDSIKQKVAEELAQIKQAVSKKAYLGSITAKNEATLTLTTHRQQTRSVILATDTAIKLKSGKDGTPADLKVGDFVLVMGDADSQNTLTAKRLLVISQPLEDKRRAVMGTITDKSSSTLTLETPNSKDTWTVKLTSTTRYTAKTKAADLKVDQKIVVLGNRTADTALTALLLHLIPAATPPSPTP